MTALAHPPSRPMELDSSTLLQPVFHGASNYTIKRLDLANKYTIDEKKIHNIEEIKKE